MSRKTVKPECGIGQLNETGLRKNPDRRDASVPPASEKRKIVRRRQIDPTTCERDYTDSEIEFMHALDGYKQSSGRMFPTCSEILEVLLKLGYRKSMLPVQSEANPPILFESSMQLQAVQPEC